MRIYLSKYTIDQLLLYPEYFINSHRRPDLLQWIVQNTPKDIYKRTKRNIVDFINDNNILSEDMLLMPF